DVIWTGEHAGVRARGQSPGFEEVVDLTLCLDRRVGPRADAVDEQREGLQASLAGLEFESGLLVQLLAQTAAGGVARVGEGREASRGAGGSLGGVGALLLSGGDDAVAQFGLERIEAFELFDADKDLAAHLDERRV